MPVTGDEALVGRVLHDRYLIGERIARGGMASVFRAIDQRLDREVAIKVMHHGLGDDQQFTERFVREAKSAAKLNHRNVVSVFDQGTDGEVTYLVMEYVPGRTLRDLMRDEAPMAPYRALELLEQVLIALSAAHAARIIHRDVKPENVLITPDGDVKVADFGLARAVSAATTATGGTLIGTVSYLAPEIVTNDGADARSDVYACGAMLYEMLTGVKPHSGESPIQVAYKHVHEDIGAPSEVQRGIPRYVDALVARATVRDRDQRSTDARVMLQQLRSVQRALAAGLDDDPELVADLMPGGRTAHDPDARTVAVPRAAFGGIGASASASAPTEAVSAPEHTMQWSNGAAATPPRGPRDAARPLGLDPPMSREQYGQVTTKPHSRRGRTLLILAVVVALLAGLGTWYFTDLRYTDTPVLTGSAATTAAKNAEAEGFVFKVAERTYSEEVTSGVVISTDPGPGEKILPGSTIEAVVSKGPERYYIPKNNLKNATIKAATAALEEQNLVLGDQEPRFSETIKKGRIIGPQDNITSETPLRRGDRVDVFVSKGREPIAVTDYSGTPADEARTALEGAGFTVATTEAFDDDVKKGTVISQDPKGGTLFRKDTVSLTVSKGPELIKVPDVTGKKKSEARRIIREAGLEFFAPYIPGAGNFVVRRQSPGGGDEVRRGARILVFPL
ncbi:Stk1 family PASTA domain-containing Ser/Thr kinase [Aeromicrobium chenweiae]|uniref:non-specific serine/threonine protein kinase n=1 Tax=Aeromicrobium chenweiae TaxID=2079793 RepID=A0A2S0WL03_9ACTN|nr:Stk1 family PASTA domain-containing Ser/Thr kinase [Aeromicrobium chenweiae]AWB91977.1 Stk1 family PASTA domain-containing Ser/Thr kinase [Aeromicrobium chenweiae]TGN32828.1 Stk1 family PASTA domain-containing Ser/Thr kinase [Aeromicrobium chenweiae]